MDFNDLQIASSFTPAWLRIRNPLATTLALALSHIKGVSRLPLFLKIAFSLRLPAISTIQAFI
ncbi:MAG: hypothetical protein ABJN43_02440 [Sneathiella sp.]